MNKKKIYKPKVVFAFVEAGMGHIIPERSIADAFEKKYGKYTRVVRSHFFAESGKKSLIRFEKLLCSNVRMYNRCPAYGYLSLSLIKDFLNRLEQKLFKYKNICSWNCKEW